MIPRTMPRGTRPAERCHRVVGVDLGQDRDQSGDAENGADLPGHVEHAAGGAEPRRRKGRTAGGSRDGIVRPTPMPPINWAQKWVT